MTIYLVPELKPRGYSGGKVYENEDVYISTVITNEGNRERIPFLIISFKKFDLSVATGPEEYKIWCSHPDPDKLDALVNDFAFGILFRALTKEYLEYILDTAIRNAFEAGREDKRMEFVKVLRGYGFGEEI